MICVVDVTRVMCVSFGPGAVETAVTSGAGMQTVVAAGVLASPISSAG